MLYVIEVWIADTEADTEKCLWFRGKTVEQAEARVEDYMAKHPRSKILRQQLL